MKKGCGVSGVDLAAWREALLEKDILDINHSIHLATIPEAHFFCDVSHMLMHSSQAAPAKSYLLVISFAMDIPYKGISAKKNKNPVTCTLGPTNSVLRPPGFSISPFPPPTRPLGCLDIELPNETGSSQKNMVSNGCGYLPRRCPRSGFVSADGIE